MRRFHCSAVKITLVQFTSLVPAQFECSPSVVDCQDSSVVAVPSYSSSSVQLQCCQACSVVDSFVCTHTAASSCVTKSQRLFSDVFNFFFPQYSLRFFLRLYFNTNFYSLVVFVTFYKRDKLKRTI